MKWASTIPSGGGGSSAIYYLHWLGLMVPLRRVCCRCYVARTAPSSRRHRQPCGLGCSSLSERAQAALTSPMSQVGSGTPLVGCRQWSDPPGRVVEEVVGEAVHGPGQVAVGARAA